MKIFISYRRKDSARDVGRIRDRLIAEFGEESVFRDLVDIPSGVDFTTVLDRETNGCDVMLVVIGPQWAGITDAQGNKRLFDPGDFTRIEVETGLRRLAEGKSRVFPVLVMNAAMPSAAELPNSICLLTNQNAIEIHDDPYFHFDMDRLIADIKKLPAYTAVEDMPHFEPQTVYIPDGAFLMGSPPGQDTPEYEIPQHEVSLPSYRIGIRSVTNLQYEEFIRQTGSPAPRGWIGRKVPAGLENNPVSGVTWFDTLEYCRWLSAATGRNYSLPNEAQLEKAHRGNYGITDTIDITYQWTCTLWGEKIDLPDLRYGVPWSEDGRNNLTANRQIRRVIRVYSYLDTALPLQRRRFGELPGEVGLPGARYSFRVVRTVQ